METVVFQDSPLADYLEGQGEKRHECESAQHQAQLDSPSAPSFAPRRHQLAYSKFRRKMPTLKLHVPPTSVVTRLQESYSTVVHAQLGQSETLRFLEQFRYPIIASQLLNSHAPLAAHNLRSPPTPSRLAQDTADEQTTIPLTGVGLFTTGCMSFALAWLIHWARSSYWGMVLVLALVGLTGGGYYALHRRHILQKLRHQAIEAAKDMITNLQSADSNISAAISLIQEVELVSRGYQISHPLPPISRLEEVSQDRRCSKMRHALRAAFASLLAPYSTACTALQSLASESDLEKYRDIYEVTQSDVDAMSDVMDSSGVPGDDESLKALKTSLQHLHTRRKLLLCILLALEAHGGRFELSTWRTATHVMLDVSKISALAAVDLDRALSDLELIPTTPSPKLPLSPTRERVRARMRKLGALSSGIRGLQAKLHILREESDRSTGAAEDLSEITSSLLLRYDSIGADIKSLLQEWEEGRAALATSMEGHERRVSRNSGSLVLSRASTPNSLGGLTAVGSGSPADALKILNGEGASPLEIASLDEEIFEAIAMPRQRSSLTREERLLKMQAERTRAAVLRERQDNTTKMVKELETVIRLRPSGTRTARVTSM